MPTTSRYQKWLTSGVALVTLSFAASLAYAQETPPTQDAVDPPTQEVVVVGVRGSVARAVKLKRDATTVQDSISALELGMFPDDNVADSLSHITGVSISRTAGGEGQKVSVRGLGPEYTLSTFNGRILATDGAGRDFAYDVLPSDVISGADVIKGAEASLTEGAIGGLINLRSASPFDKRGQHGILRLEGDKNLMSKLDGKKFSGVYSNTFADDKLGVLFGIVLENRNDRTDEAGNDGGWTRNPDPNDPSWLYGNAWGGNIDPNNNGVLDPDEYGLIGPGQFRVGSILEKKKRSAYTAKVEWRPNDNFRLVIDGLTTKLDSPQVGYQQSFYPLYAPGRWSNMVIQNGIVTSFDMTDPDPELRLNPELLNQTTYRVVETKLYGANAEWRVSDTLTLTGDIYRSTSSRHSGGQDSYVVLRMNQPNSAHISLTGAAVPNVTVNFDDGRELASGLANGQFTDADFNTHYFSLSGDNIDDAINGATVSGKWAVGRFWVDNLQFGVSYTDRSKSRDLINNSLTGGADYYSGDHAINVGDLTGNVVSHSFTLPNFMNGVNADFPHTFLAFDVANYQKALAAYDGHPRAGGDPGEVYTYASAAPVWNPLQSYRVTEKTWAGYVQANLAGERWTGNAGLRVVRTNTTAQAWDAKILNIIENGAFNYTAVYAAPTPVSQDNEYTYVLPSANFNYRITEELRLRLGAARTMARPSVETLAPTSTTESVSWGDFTQVYGGNAALKPYSADQFDASLEWYFGKNSIFNLAVFDKQIKDQITTSWEPGQDIGVPGHLFNISRPINGDHAKVRGIEIGLQHFLENGLGMRAQYTRNWAKSWVGDEERPLEGIAPSVYSLGVFYEHGRVSLSLTGDHTDGFVTAINVLGEGYNEQADPITWVTAHASYKINDRTDITLEGQNLLNEANTYSINGNRLLPQGYYRYGASVKLGVSYRF
ncbi:TonB-dependent receptor [Asticcacaulis sp. 201]|uniref:TonB-dependent receptor n=1 Tax=Asticcacaulis sp. 201 TaxID=3028787 RepID=UPI002916027C|nr:TonB-dependent receptor [Asticcacaulis sp. 201]MDV6330825.1 TonB-dependent receptor [Asticcacaulis sp. 201]